MAATWGRAMTVPTAVLTRVGSAAVILPVFVLLVVRGPAWAFQAVVVAASAVAAWELARLLDHAGWPADRWLTTATAAGLTASFLVPQAPPLVFTALVALVLCAPLWRDAPLAVEPVLGALLGLVYVGWLLGHALWLHGLPDGAWLILFVAGVTWAGETAAYVVGSVLGRRPLAPVVSPRKTMEGAAAQIVVSIAAALVLEAWLLGGWSAPLAAGAGVLLGVVGQAGDLAESVIKRSVGVKDSGGILPGHGGLLDRLDSLLFNVPALFYYVLFVVGGGRP